MQKSIAYSDGVEVEKEIFDILVSAQKRGSQEWIHPERYGSWPIHYHLSPERSVLLRHFDFSNLDVLELGAGMGSISRYLAENCHHLTMVEGTEARLLAAKERLRDLSNWSAIQANIFDLKLDQKFDVVTLIGVLEYAELYGPSANALLEICKKWLKPEGVLIVAIENRLGIKYWCGSAEDHTGKLFDGILGYPDSRSPRTYSRDELNSLLTSTGFGRIEEYYPFPDYKLPSCILTPEFCRSHSDLAAEVAIGTTIGVNEGGNPATFFSYPVAIDSVSRAGLLPLFSNSFMFVAALENKGSSVFHKLNRKSDEVAWHYSLRRSEPLKTIFFNSNDGDIQVRKEFVNQSASTPQEFVNLLHNIPTLQKCVRGESLRLRWARKIYFGDWESLYSEFLNFSKWSFAKWKISQQNGDQTALHGRALDAVFTNTHYDKETNQFLQFDLEWEWKKAIPCSWWVLRNILMWMNGKEEFTMESPFKSYGELYERICLDLGLTPQLREDFFREFEFQRIVAPFRVDEGREEAMLTSFMQPFRRRRFFRAAFEFHGVENLICERNSLLEERSRLCLEIERLNGILHAPRHEIAEKVNTFIPKSQGLRNVMKAIIRKFL